MTDTLKRDQVTASLAYDRTARYFLTNGHSPSLSACQKSARDALYSPDADPFYTSSVALLVSFTETEFLIARAEYRSAMDALSGSDLSDSDRDVIAQWSVTIGYALLFGGSELAWSRGTRLASIVAR